MGLRKSIDVRSISGYMDMLARGELHEFIRAAGIRSIATVSMMSGLLLSFVSYVSSSSPDIAIFTWLAVFLIPPAWAYHVISSYDSEIESRAPEFFYDLSEQVKAGGSMARSLKRLSRQEYGAMSDEVLRTLSEIEDEGCDIQTAMSNMAGRVHNRYIYRSVAVLREALRSSSNVEQILKIISGEGRMSRSLLKEKTSGLSSSIFVIYLTSIIFLGVVSLCITSFVPLSDQIRSISAIDSVPVRDAAMPYYVLSMSVALCSGATAGMMRDSSIYGGFKDAVLLAGLVFLVYELIVFPGVNLMEAWSF